MKKRQSGVLMHISSLPGAYGIGSFGKSAYDFVDFLVRTKQRYWQILPLGTTSYGDSPYQSFSAFAGNTHFIDLDILVEQGLLQACLLYTSFKALFFIFTCCNLNCIVVFRCDLGDTTEDRWEERILIEGV